MRDRPRRRSNQYNSAIEISLLFFLLLLSDSSITLVLLAKYRDEMERGDPQWGGEVDY